MSRSVLGECAVDGCTHRATRDFTIGTGRSEQAVASICDAHGEPELEPGWILRTALGRSPVLYPPGTELPPL